MRKLLPFVVLATLIVSCKKNEKNPNEVNSSDKIFLVQTYQAARAEIKAGEQALSKSNNAVIQNFSQRIIADYQSMRSDLIAVANKINFTMTDTTTVQIQTVSDGTNLTGYSFDTAYISSRARTQLNLLKIFQNQLNNGNNTYVRYYFLNKYVDRIKAYFFEADSTLRKL